MHERFSNHTVISIVHKIESALDDFDIVVLLDGGELRELGPPRELLNKGPEISPFAALYESLIPIDEQNDKDRIEVQVSVLEGQPSDSSTIDRNTNLDA